jgi:hypothetical protein
LLALPPPPLLLLLMMMVMVIWMAMITMFAVRTFE